MLPEGRGRSLSNSRTSGSKYCASFAICSRDGVFGLASRLAVGLFAVVGVLVSSDAGAELLPIRQYTTADGLLRDNARTIYSDSHGFIWLMTSAGLSRFDGYEFTNFGSAQGLPADSARALLEREEGTFWVGTDNGLFLFDPYATEPNSVFSSIKGGDSWRSLIVNVISRTNDGTVLVGTMDGVYQLELDGDTWTMRAFDFNGAANLPRPNGILDIAEFEDGRLWFATVKGLICSSRDGEDRLFSTQDGFPTNRLRALVHTSDNQLWLATSTGLAAVDISSAGKMVVLGVLTNVHGLPHDTVWDIHLDSDGTLWVATSGGLAKSIKSEFDELPRFRGYTPENGLADRFISSIAEDHAGNLWIGTESGGAMRIARGGFTTFGIPDGLKDTKIHSVFEDQSGNLCVVSAINNRFIHRFDGKRFLGALPMLPSGTQYGGWGTDQIALQDHAGEWWMLTGEGVLRYPEVDDPTRLASTPPKALYTMKDGFGSEEGFRVFEDSQHDIWISTLGKGVAGVVRWSRTDESFHRFTETEGFPEGEAATAFLEDSYGNMWIGFYDSGIGRWNGSNLKLFGPDPDVPSSSVWAFFLDQNGRLWAGLQGDGLIRIDAPDTDSPRFVSFTVDDGLACNTVRSIVEDRWGRLYLGTPLGVDRFEPESGRVRHYTSADGLANNEQLVSFRDRNDVLWFGSLQGLSRFEPESVVETGPSPIWIRGLRINGIEQNVPVLGARHLGALKLATDQRQIEVEFGGVSFEAGERLRYQYMLFGGDARWSVPTESRSLVLANLAPGSYRLAVRAVRSDEQVSSEPATVTFTITPQFWRRGWFLPLLGILIAGLAYGAYRVRLARAVELEKLRTRIATDLHDDIGSSLSQVAILSEVARRSVNEKRPEEVGRFLEQIAETSRQVLDSMGDVVWAINPTRDRLSDLLQRTLRFASDICGNRQIELSFVAPERGRDLRLGVNIQRQTFLVCKESINNAVRHSDCTSVEIRFSWDRGWLEYTFSDNGRGIKADQNHDGNGLESMSNRAAAVRGSLKIASKPGIGTTVQLRVPLSSSSWRKSSSQR